MGVSAGGSVFVPGKFYVGPIHWGGFAWCLTADGNLFRVPIAAASKPLLWASIPSTRAGFGMSALVEIDDPAATVRGPVIVAADDRAIYAVSLVNRRVVQLFDSGASGGMLVNAASEESVRYRAIAATPTGYVSVSAAGSGDSVLTIRAFNAKQAGRAIPLRGKDFIGPIAVDGKFCVVIGDEVIICSAHDGYRAGVPLPDGFRPFFERPDTPNVPPGTIPLALTRGGTVCIAGRMRGSRGVLALDVASARYQFGEVSPKGCISVFSPSEMAINQGSRVDFLGCDKPAGRIGALAPSMPVGKGLNWISYFAQDNQLAVLGAEPFDAPFADQACHADSCCGVSEANGSLVVSYFDRGGASAPGMKFAVYSIVRGNEGIS